MDKLQQLMDLCKCGVYVEINKHRGYYETPEQNLTPDEIEDIDPDIWAKIKETNTLIEVQAYPRTPISFLKIHHYDLGQALSLMIRSIEGDKEDRV